MISINNTIYDMRIHQTREACFFSEWHWTCLAGDFGVRGHVLLAQRSPGAGSLAAVARVARVVVDVRRVCFDSFYFGVCQSVTVIFSCLLLLQLNGMLHSESIGQ